MEGNKAEGWRGCKGAKGAGEGGEEARVGEGEGSEFQ